MAKRTHDRQLARAREKRRRDALARRRARSRLLVFVLIGLLVLSFGGFAALSALGGDDPAPIVEDVPGDGEAAEEDTADGEVAAGERPEGACPETPDDVPQVSSELYDEPPALTIDEDATYTATIATTCGDIVVELDAATAPLAVNSFVFLAEEGYYEGVGFHRVIDGFVVQAGDPTGTGCGRQDCGPAAADEPAFPGYTFEDELAAAEALVEETGGYPQGTLAMANAGPDTNGSQWFIVQPEDGAELPPSYTAFGRVLEGQDVVDAIALGPVSGDAPVDPVVITSVTVQTA